MHQRLLRVVARSAARAIGLVLIAASAALILVHLAPGDAFTQFDLDPSVAAVERHRHGLDRPFVVQYGDWLARSARFDFGDSVRFRRPVSALLAERAWNTVLLGVTALLLALAAGVPAGVRTGSAPGHWTSRVITATSLLLVSVPPLVTSLLLLLIAARTGWAPAGGLGEGGGGALWSLASTLEHLPLPALALALPVAASIERLQSRAMQDAVRDPSVIAARARGLSEERAVWNHAFRLSLAPVLGVLGIIIGGLLSGSFVVEVIMAWPGLGDLMFEALVARDGQLAAGCAAVGALFLGAGILVADVARFTMDPRVADA